VCSCAFVACAVALGCGGKAVIEEAEPNELCIEANEHIAACDPAPRTWPPLGCMNQPEWLLECYARCALSATCAAVHGEEPDYSESFVCQERCGCLDKRDFVAECGDDVSEIRCENPIVAECPCSYLRQCAAASVWAECHVANPACG
jgi:hypothetical protein